MGLCMVVYSAADNLGTRSFDVSSYNKIQVYCTSANKLITRRVLEFSGALGEARQRAALCHQHEVDSFGIVCQVGDAKFCRDLNTRVVKWLVATRSGKQLAGSATGSLEPGPWGGRLRLLWLDCQCQCRCRYNIFSIFLALLRGGFQVMIVPLLSSYLFILSQYPSFEGM